MNAEVLIKSKADQVVSYISDWLKSGKLKVGDKLPSERELAKKLGVSLLTVNKAMARLEDAQLLTRSAGRGTLVANLPSADAISVICDICHLTDANHSPFFDALIENLLEAAEGCGMVPHFMIGKGKSTQNFLKSLGIQSAVWRNITGSIAMAWREGLEESLLERGIPLVTISTKRQVGNSIILDYEEMGRMAARVLAEKAPQTIYVIHNKIFAEKCWNNPVTTFFDELTKLNLDAQHVCLIPVEPNQEAGFEAARQIAGKATHIFIADDNIAAGFARWMNENDRCCDKNTQIVTHASEGIDLPLPEAFDKLAFVVKDICAEALNLLEELSDRRFHDSSQSSLRFVKPILIRGQK